MTELREKARELIWAARSIVERHKWLASDQGLNFNVFDVLDRATDEVKGHSAFIGELLNPQGRHGQGGKFLEPFLERLRKLSPGKTGELGEPADSDAWTVATEKPFVIPREDNQPVTGRIDIILECPTHVLIIENKIYADDQYRQLERYRQYATQTRKTCRLVYLTLDGHEPSAGSLGCLSPHDVLTLSYESDINAWIDRCIEVASQLPHLRETLVQYQRVIRRLANGTSQREMIREITTLLTDKDSLEAAMEIGKAVRKKKIEIQMNFWTTLEQRLKTILHLGLGGGFSYSPSLVDTYHTNSRKTRGYGLRFPIEPEDLSIALMVRLDWNIYYGFVLLKDTEEQKFSEHPTANRVMQTLSETETELQPHKDLMYYWRYPEKPLKFDEFCDNCMGLADPEVLKEDVGHLAAEIKTLVERFQDTYRKTIGTDH